MLGIIAIRIRLSIARIHRTYRNAKAVAHRGDWNQTRRNIFMDVAVVESLRSIDPPKALLIVDSSIQIIVVCQFEPFEPGDCLKT